MFIYQIQIYIYILWWTLRLLFIIALTDKKLDMESKCF